MGVPEILELATLIILASTKFAFAVGALASPLTSYSYVEMVLILIAGGFIGVFFFYFFSNWVNKILDKLFNKKKKEKKLFSKKVRRFIRIKNKYGIIGISLISPILISIPVGSFIASRFFSKKKYTIIVMLAGVIFWSLVLPLIKLSY